jgi:superfamily II DNA or RNA helicase
LITVTIDNRLRVRKSHLPIGHEAAIKQRLTVANGDKTAAAKRRQWGWQDLPDSFTLYEDDGPYLIMPRGYAAELRAGLELSGEQVKWDDHTSAHSLRIDQMVTQGPALRPEQEEACSAILRHRQGVLQAPAGGGKTVTVLEAWRRTGLTGLILVEKAQLAKQWRERAREHLGVEVGMIGEGEWEEKALTVAMLQTLHRRELGESWWDRFGFTTLDEAHRARAETYNHVLRQARSRYLLGVTATPLEGMWEQPFLVHTLGPIFHITTPETLRRTGQRVTPQIVRVHTGWRWVPANAKDEQLVDTKVIYKRIEKALERDRERVSLIASNVVAQPRECAQLVLSKSLNHLDLIESGLFMAGYEGDVYKMIGAVPAERREEIAQLADAGECVIIATDKVAGEGMDIRRLDRLHLTWPQRQELGLTQQLGRVLRTHPDKREVVVFDYVDSEGMLANQARLRAITYRKAGYSIKERNMQRSFTS